MNKWLTELDDVSFNLIIINEGVVFKDICLHFDEFKIYLGERLIRRYSTMEYGNGH
jgi:hypothetical protein